MKSRYPDAAQAIRNWIVAEKLSAGTILPSGTALAAQFHFTPATILRACQVLISSGLLHRVGYKLSVRTGISASSPIQGQVFVVSYDEPFSRAAGRILAERKVPHRLINLSWIKHPCLPPVLEQILKEKPAGVILWKGEMEEDTERLLERISLPMTIYTGGIFQSSHSLVQTDLYRGTEKALGHLYELGHRQIAHFSCGHSSIDRELREHYRDVCLKLNLKKSASMIWQAGTAAHELICDTLLAKRKRHPGVTALFGDDRAGVCATEVFAVPKELSVVGFYGMEGGHKSKPPLTTVAIRDPDSIALWACTDIISRIQTLESGRPPKTPSLIMFVPDLFIRKSTQALITPKTTQKHSVQPSLSKPTPAATWRNVYPFLKKNDKGAWHQVDLSKLANHSMTKQHGWLGGEPLLHFPSGLRSIHGVPFQVLDESHNASRAVVTFRSPHSHSVGKKPLPVTAKVKLGHCVKALYFLHGCGYATLTSFAAYIMHFKTGIPLRQPLVPLAHSPFSNRKSLGNLKPNLQDWWKGFEQRDFPHAHRALIFDPAHPDLYERSLYSLEWINPRPKDELDTIEVQVDPLAGPTLALIAVTALL